MIDWVYRTRPSSVQPSPPAHREFHGQAYRPESGTSSEAAGIYDWERSFRITFHVSPMLNPPGRRKTEPIVPVKQPQDQPYLSHVRRTIFPWIERARRGVSSRESDVRNRDWTRVTSACRCACLQRPAAKRGRTGSGSRSKCEEIDEEDQEVEQFVVMRRGCLAWSCYYRTSSNQECSREMYVETPRS